MTRRRVLLIEDSPTQARGFQAQIASPEIEVVPVSSAEAAFDDLAKNTPDAIIVDYHLPGKNGDEFCREIKSSVNTRGIPVLMLTVDEGNAAQMRGLESGADDYLPKSADPDVLRARVNALLRESKIAAPIVDLERSRGQVRVLVMDDSPTYLYHIAHELKPANYLVDTVTNPVEGIEKVRVGQYDCVLVDCEMTPLDGFAVCRKIREQGNAVNPQVILLMVSSHEDKEHIKQGFEAGADDYIFKSADAEILRARIEAFLRRRFLVGQNRQILEELREKELRAVRAQMAQREAEARAALVDQLAAANRELALANLKLDSANRELEQFSYSVAHDLKEPLRVVATYGEMLRKRYAGKLDRDADQFIQWSIEATRRMERFIQDLLGYARASNTVEDIPRTLTPLKELVDRALGNLSVAVQESESEIAVEDLPALLVEASRIQQVFQNLLGNAVKYRRPDTRVKIRVSAEKSAEAWTISVQDNGSGIEAEDLKAIFELFHRGRNMYTAGTGVGLSICRRIVERHGGIIWAESEVGKGSTFRFTIPHASS